MRTLGALGEVVGLAAGICTREGCAPRQVYTEHLDKLKALMERGVVINPQHAYGTGDYETLAFKECDILRTYPEPLLPLDDKQWMWKINNSGINYRGREKFVGIENRQELTDEEREIADRFNKAEKPKLGRVRFKY